MEYKLMRKTVTSSVYAIDNAFYLIVPKIVVDKNIKVVVETGVNGKLDEISNTSVITVARPFASDYFEHINELAFRQGLKSMISNDLSLAKEVLAKENVEYNDVSSLSTPFNEFKEWYDMGNNTQKKMEEISSSVVVPEENYSVDNEDINATLRFKKDLLELREEVVSKSKDENGNEKGKAKVLSNGKGTLKSFDDGFVNIIFLSIVTLTVTVGTMLAMIYIMS